MLARVLTCAVVGLDGREVTVEADIAGGTGRSPITRTSKNAERFTIS